MVRQTVEQGCGQAFVSKDLDPIGELQVSGDDHRQPFVELRAEGEEHLGAIGGEGDKAQFIQNDQILFEGGSDHPVKAVLVLCLEQFIH